MYYYQYYKELIKFYIKNFTRRCSTRSDFEYLDIGIINPAIGTSNLGDLIIYESIMKELRCHYPDDLFTNYPSQFHTAYDLKKMMAEKDYLFVSGTNLLSSNMDRQYQWKVNSGHKRFLANKVILCGVGWWQYQKKPNRYTRDLYKKLFNSDHLHSVRDSYTKNMLKSIGIHNVVNTTCPTLWGLTPDLCSQIPTEKSPSVVTTLTFYKAAPDLDKRMLDILVDKYEKVYLWVQGLEDVKYLKEIFPQFNKIHLIPPTIEAYDNILNDPTVEYVGTRLHAGARSLQKGVRTLILAVDNRAIEIGKDINLNVIKRGNFEQMVTFIDNSYKTNINLPSENIAMWQQNLPKK